MEEHSKGKRQWNNTLHHVAMTPDIQEEHQSVDNVTAEKEPSGFPAEVPQEEVKPEV